MQKYSEIVATTKADGTVEVLPNATITVYLAGTTTPATIYSDNGITVKANPFQSAALTGRVEFYAADGRYDIKVDKAGYTTVTVADVLLEDPEDIGLLQDVTLVDATISSSTVTSSTLSQCVLVNTTIQDIDSLQFTDTPDALTPRRMAWNADEGTLDVALDSNTTLQMGQELHYRARNNTASTIADGAVVWATGTTGATGRINIGLAVADGSQPGKTVMGLMTHATAAGTDGYVAAFGKVRGINTTGSAVGETWVNGDILYLHPTTPGALTKVKPAVNGHIVVTVAIVIHAGNNGTLFVRPSADSQEADEIRYTPSGTGAVATTVQTKLRETVSVKDFGAVGNGVEDDTIEIQAALNSGAKTVHLVSTETYLVSSTLLVPAGVIIQGNGAHITCSTHFKVMDFVDGGGVFNLSMTGAGGSSYAAGSIAIGCSGTNNAPSAPTYVAGPTIENCTISGFGEYGVFLEYVKLAKIKDNKITAVGYAGIGGVSCEDVIVDGNTIKDITAGSAGGDAYGVFIDRRDGTSETAEPRSYRCIITNNIIENVTATAANNGQGIDTHAGVDFIIDSNKITNCEAGIFVTASSISGSQALGPIRCVVSNNIITSSLFANYGILVYGARNGATVAQHAEDCIVSGNILVGHGLKTSSTVPGMFLSATKNVVVTGNVFKQCGGSCVMLDFQNVGVNISGNDFVDPQSTTFSAAACVYVYSIDNSGFIGGNTYRYEDSGLATYVSVNAVRIESGLTGLDLDFGQSTFQGIDASHLAFLPLTTSGVRYAGLHRSSGSGTISVSSGVADGITDVAFPKRFPYAPKVIPTLRYPFNGGGKFPVLGVDTSVAISATGFRIYAKPTDGSTWTATGSLSFDWVAE